MVLHIRESGSELCPQHSRPSSVFSRRVAGTHCRSRPRTRVLDRPACERVHGGIGGSWHFDATRQGRGSQMTRKRSGNGPGFVVVAFFAVLVGLCSRKSEDVPRQLSEPQQSIAVSQLPVAAEPDLEERYVDADALNVRSSPNGKVVGKLRRSDSVTVHGQDASWVRISADGKPMKWVSSERLCAAPGCASKTSARASRSARDAGPAPSASRTSFSSGSGCPCSSSNNCFGPRGGRYCITSGGNKRYR
ncbi:SH3 domain-containing protein [Stenotrophomonas bentonitica]|uniref:SH3 domain-containing protein n=1 Tax=Stenotrophomonas bentonitica TaxID=1450134 RepID=UPI000C9CFB8F